MLVVSKYSLPEVSLCWCKSGSSECSIQGTYYWCVKLLVCQSNVCIAFSFDKIGFMVEHSICAMVIFEMVWLYLKSICNAGSITAKIFDPITDCSYSSGVMTTNRCITLTDKSWIMQISGTGSTRTKILMEFHLWFYLITFRDWLRSLSILCVHNICHKTILTIIYTNKCETKLGIRAVLVITSCSYHESQNFLGKTYINHEVMLSSFTFSY